MYIFTDGITEIKDVEGKMLESQGFQNYIKKYQEVPNNERLNKIIEDIIKSGRIQKDDLTIVVVDGNDWNKQDHDCIWNNTKHNFILGF